MLKNSKFQKVNIHLYVNKIYNHILIQDKEIDEIKNDNRQKSRKNNSNKKNRFFGREIKNETLNIILNLSIKERNHSKEEKNRKNQNINNIKQKENNYILLGRNIKKIKQEKDKEEKEKEFFQEENDIKNKNNPQFVTEYSNSIMLYLKETEMINIPNYKHLFKKQKSININQRTGVINWIISVCERFSLLPETFYLSLNIFDRYLEKNKLSQNNLQLISCTSIFIASKYEEIYAPEINDFIFISKHTFSKEEILETEYEILKSLNFDLLTVSPYIFLERFYYISDDLNKKILYLSQYILDICLTDIDFCIYNNSMKAASVLFLSRKILCKNKKYWNNTLRLHTNYSEKDLKFSVKEASKFTSAYVGNKFSKNYKKLPIYVKYSSSKYEFISKYFDNYCYKERKKKKEDEEEL